MSDKGRVFSTDNKTYWHGAPDILRGEIHQSEFEVRKASNLPYACLHLGEVGRRGAPWGTLFLEIRGTVYHFRADETLLSRNVQDGHLTEKGKCQVACGTTSVLDCNIPWKWIQESIALSKLLTEVKVVKLKGELDHLLKHQDKLPKYQAYQYALERGIMIDRSMDNCASFTAHCLDIEVPIEIARMPIPLFDHIKSLV